MGIRTRRARQHSRTHVVALAIAGFFAFFALLVATLFVSLTLTVNEWLQDLPDYQAADAYLVPEPTTLFASDGTTVIAEYYLQNRRTIEMDEVSPYVIQATIDTEDRRFYKHNGVDPQGIARAIVSQLSGGSQGASTITQQLVRNTVLSEEQFDYSLRRKAREAYIALQMEKMYTKDQILMMYLNTIYYGDGAYGIEAASINYFDKHASELTIAEAALLAGLPAAPSAYDPTINPDLAVERRNFVLAHMYEEGDITQEEYEAALAEELVLNHGDYPDSVGPYPYFSDYVRSILVEDFDTNTVLQGGLQVYTTLDTTWQRYAEESVAEQCEIIGNDQLEFGLAAIDPKTGYVKAIVGGRDYEKSQYNTATQARRQPGSSMKMFTLVTAIQEGMNPDIILNANSPLKVTDDWEVINYGGASYGYVTLKYATAQSLNTPFAQVALAVGIDKVIANAHAMGIDVDLPSYPSIALGSIGIPPIQMAEAYATLAADGVHRDAVVITRIEDRNGNVVYEHKDNPEQVIAPEVAEATTDVLMDTCRNGGTADVLQYNFSINQPVAGKSGTSSGARDLWFCGYTPSMCCAIWCGYLEESMIYIYGYEGHGYQSCVPVWGRFATKLYADSAWEDFPDCGIEPTYKDNTSWTFACTESYINDPYWQWQQQEAARIAAEEAEKAAEEEAASEEESGGDSEEYSYDEEDYSYESDEEW